LAVSVIVNAHSGCYYRWHLSMTSSRCLISGCFAAVLLANVFPVSIAAQTCGPKPAALIATGPNIFSEQQEQWLGDAMADLVEAKYRPVRDPAENAYLQSIADRLLAVLPPTGIHFRLLMIDSPEINGFSLAGGRIYITRKLVANANSEDEVAAVIGHEMGHILSHQFATDDGGPEAAAQCYVRR
jgi:predicted Zn-dependent protease